MDIKKAVPQLKAKKRNVSRSSKQIVFGLLLAVIVALIGGYLIVSYRNSARAETQLMPAPTALPTVPPTQQVVANPPAATQPTSSASTSPNIWWSSPDAFDSTAGDYALGDKDLVVYGQTWDGKDVATTKHFVVMPGLILRIKGWVGTRWMLNGRDTRRWQEMRIETQKRDNLKSVPDLIVIDSLTDSLTMKSLPAGWSIEAFPSPAP